MNCIGGDTIKKFCAELERRLLAADASGGPVQVSMWLGHEPDHDSPEAQDAFQKGWTSIKRSGECSLGITWYEKQ